MKFLRASILVAVVCSAAYGQSDSTAVEPAQAASSQQLQIAPAGERKPSGIELLARKSKFFPEIAASKEPLSAQGKFRLFAVQSVSPGNITGAAFTAGFGQAINRPEGYGQGGEGYGKRFGANVATRTSRNLFGTFLIPTLTRHDPRYFMRGDGSFHQSLKYAFRHVVISRNDSGKDAINWAGFLAPVAAQSLANTYLPDQERTVGRTFARSGRMIGWNVAANVLREYWPTIFKRLRPQKSGDSASYRALDNPSCRTPAVGDSCRPDSPSR